MKTITITITMLAAGLLSGCLPTDKPKTSSNGTSGMLHFVITQPASIEAAKDVVAAIREPLTAIAKASNGASVPIPEIRVLRGLGDDGLVPVVGAAPSGFAKTLFGDSAPSVKQQLLENTLKALEETLAKGIKDEPLDARTIKEKAQTAFKNGLFTAWNVRGGGSLWKSKEAGPTTVLDDRAAFTQKVAGDQSGSFLVVTDLMGAKVAENKMTEAEKQPVSLERPEQVATEAQADSGKQAEANMSVVPQRDNINIGINLTTPERAASSGQADGQSQSSTRAVSLPPGVVPVGDPIHFESNSAKLTKGGLNAVKRAASELKKSGDSGNLRIFLLGSADRRSDDQWNAELSQMRAEAVEAALLREGITVEKTISIGERLSPDDSAKTELAGQRIVQIYLLPAKASAPPEPVKPLARRTK